MRIVYLLIAFLIQSEVNASVSLLSQYELDGNHYESVEYHPSGEQLVFTLSADITFLLNTKTGDIDSLSFSHQVSQLAEDGENLYAIVDEKVVKIDAKNEVSEVASGYELSFLGDKLLVNDHYLMAGTYYKEKRKPSLKMKELPAPFSIRKDNSLGEKTAATVAYKQGMFFDSSELQLWDLPSGKSIAKKEFSGRIFAPHFVDEKNALLLVNNIDSLFLWDFKEDEILDKQSDYKGHRLYQMKNTLLEVSSDKVSEIRVSDKKITRGFECPLADENIYVNSVYANADLLVLEVFQSNTSYARIFKIIEGQCEQVAILDEPTEIRVNPIRNEIVALFTHPDSYEKSVLKVFAVH
ncbi:hypothetical protein W04_1748 [Pseudoalteromonas sp. SW0106-04]|uniref:hypothetical protein n=1 Tax=Pseudoalteromonas sp. SW0106-04 TaxID=1702169 RepID=UPI0006B4E52F|nr:hypothetical protein [Pseudoalteromonas sp. SW0106-04]GAP75228.1 hypothetical protein W04_1748 [Pseudoalteromonas sp. SW0106-04]